MNQSCVLSRVQNEVGEWAKEQFKDNESKRPGWEGIKLFSTPSFQGMVEEIGELAAVEGKSHQGRFKGTPEEAQAHREDALADLLIFACDYASRENISLAQVLARTWDTIVSKRRQKTWNEDKAKEVPLGSKVTGTTTDELKSFADSVNPDKIMAANKKSTTENILNTESKSQTGQGWAEPPLEENSLRVVSGIYSRTYLHQLADRALSDHETREHLQSVCRLANFSFVQYNTWHEVVDALLDGKDFIKIEVPKRDTVAVSEPLETGVKIPGLGDRLFYSHHLSAIRELYDKMDGGAVIQIIRKSPSSVGAFEEDKSVQAPQITSILGHHRKPLDSSYNRYCKNKHCPNRVHNMSQSDYCASCKEF